MYVRDDLYINRLCVESGEAIHEIHCSEKTRNSTDVSTDITFKPCNEASLTRESTVDIPFVYTRENMECREGV